MFGQIRRFVSKLIKEFYVSGSGKTWKIRKFTKSHLVCSSAVIVITSAIVFLLIVYESLNAQRADVKFCFPLGKNAAETVLLL